MLNGPHVLGTLGTSANRDPNHFNAVKAPLTSRPILTRVGGWENKSTTVKKDKWGRALITSLTSQSITRVPYLARLTVHPVIHTLLLTSTPLTPPPFYTSLTRIPTSTASVQQCLAPLCVNGARVTRNSALRSE